MAKMPRRNYRVNCPSHISPSRVWAFVEKIAEAYGFTVGVTSVGAGSISELVFYVEEMPDSAHQTVLEECARLGCTAHWE